uniref:NB-ARC domain-containing protein n=1 Tax=Lactuca sativa TaxID=4236 RepID=A0A9R1XUY5_LACSA|nr:hypothetical protein LSAT_V11C200060400 [Lactuca sativa]
MELICSKPSKKSLQCLNKSLVVSHTKSRVQQKKPTSDIRTYLIGSLNEQLASNIYLLVLDDVWVEERPYWEEFRSCMLNVSSQNGSLSNDHCWDILEKAFVKGTLVSPKLVKIGRGIVEKCGGLPLLLNIIGGMLAHYNDIEKWLSIKNRKVWDLEEERDKIQKSLELSFDNLPNSIVKQCFVYCSIFKKDTVMEREELVRLWMALGLVQEDEERNKEMEDVGNDIFQILVSNSLFQDVRRDEYGHITHCSMHVWCMIFHYHFRNMKAYVWWMRKMMTLHVKHLAFYQEQNEDDELKAKVSTLIERNKVATILHTLFIKIQKKFSLKQLKCIRILTLKGYSVHKLGNSVGGLVHLRYLDFSFTRISALPESIGKLYHLQTLKLSNRIEQFPESMRNLICHLISLRKLYFVKVLRRKGCGIEELRHLNNLTGSLYISHLENVRSKEDAVKADISRKKNLYIIEFSWSKDYKGSDRVDKDVLEGLQPPADLKILTIRSFSGDNFTEWHLPHLRDLVLEDMDSLTCLKNFDVTGSTKPLSPSLRSLQLFSMKRLEK